MERDSDLRRRAAVCCLIGAPLVLTTGDLLSVQAVLSRYAQQSYPALVVHLLSCTLLFGATLGLVHLLRRPAPLYSLIVSAVAALGFLGGTNIMAVRIYQWALQTGDSALYSQVMQTMRSGPQATIGPVILGPGLFTPIALLLAGIGLWRWTRLPRWSLALLLLGALLFPAGRVSVTLALIFASDAVLLVALISLGLYVLRQPEPWAGDHESEPDPGEVERMRLMRRAARILG